MRRPYYAQIQPLLWCYDNDTDGSVGAAILKNLIYLTCDSIYTQTHTVETQKRENDKKKIYPLLAQSVWPIRFAIIIVAPPPLFRPRTSTIFYVFICESIALCVCRPLINSPLYQIPRGASGRLVSKAKEENMGMFEKGNIRNVAGDCKGFPGYDSCVWSMGYKSIMGPVQSMRGMCLVAINFCVATTDGSVQ